MPRLNYNRKRNELKGNPISKHLTVSDPKQIPSWFKNYINYIKIPQRTGAANDVLTIIDIRFYKKNDQTTWYAIHLPSQFYVGVSACFMLHWLGAGVTRLPQ